MIFILDRNENVINILRNNGGVSDTPPIFNDVHSEDLSTGAEIFSFSTLGQGSISSDLSIGNYVAFKKNGKFKLFQIMESEERHEQEKVIEVYCESAGLELINKVFRKRTMKGVNLRQFLKTVLDETGWAVGRISGTSDKVLDFEIEDESVYSVLQNNLNKYDVEFEFRVEINNNRIVGKYIDTYAHRGMVTGKRFSFGRDIEGITRKRSGTELYTALIGRGKDGLTFKDVTVDGIDKPLGQDFVADQEAYNRYNHNGYHIMGVFDYDTDNAGELLRETYRRLQKVKDVKVEYEVKVALLSDLLKEEWNDVQIGDTVTIVDHAFNPPIQLAARVSKLDTSFTDPSVNACTLSNFIELKSNITNDMRKIASQLEGYVDSQFPIGGDKIQNGAISQEQMNERYVATLTTDILEAGKVVTNELIAENAKIVNAEIETLKAKDAEIENAVIENLEATNAEIEFLKAKDAEIEKVVAEKVTTEELEAMEAKIGSAIIGSAEILDAKINILEADFAEIDTLLAGNITADNIKADSITADKIQTGTITAGSGVIANGAIGNAQISDIDAGKISAGKIDTSKVEVVGADGHLKIKGNRLQVFQGTGKDAKERVSIGDVNNDGTVYGLRVRGADGETILLDENGVTQEGITDGSITNDKISGEANIDGSKININSVVTRINEDGTEVIKGNKIDVDGTNLSVKLSTITDKQDENSNRITQNSSRIDATEESIALKVDSQSYTEEVNKINNNISSINTNVSKNTTSIELLKDSITSKVSQTEVSEIIENVGTGNRNRALKTKNDWVGVTNFSGRDNDVRYNHHVVLDGLQVGDVITIALEYKLENLTYNSNAAISVQGSGDVTEWNGGGFPRYYLTLANEGEYELIEKYVITDKDIRNSRWYFSIRFDKVTGGTFYLKGLRVVKTALKPEWTPAPEDVNETIATVDSKVTTVSNKASAIEQTVNSITQRVSSTETKLETTENKIDNIQIGGRNLIKNSNFMLQATASSFAPAQEVALVNGLNLTEFFLGKTVTFSYFIHSMGDRQLSNSVHVNLQNRFGIHGTVNYKNSQTGAIATDYPFAENLSGAFKNTRISMQYTFSPPRGFDTITAVNFSCQAYAKPSSDNDEVWKIGQPKLEIGNKATDWTPAPEDIDTSLSKVNSGVNKWLLETFERGSVTGTVSITVEDLLGKTPTKTLLIEDSTNFANIGDNYLGRCITNVYFDADYSWTTSAKSDDGGTLYLNGKKIATTSTTAINVTLPFNKGWNKITWVYNENSGSDGCVFGTKLSSLSQVKIMSAYPQTNINEDIKTINANVYKKTETYSKTETDSAINIAKDQINLNVSNTYETKSNVETKISSAKTEAINTSKSYADTKKNEAISTASTDATNKVNSAKNELNTAINKKANSTDVYTKSQVYTKEETNSQINIAKDNINLGISNTYETKANVESKVTTTLNSAKNYADNKKQEAISTASTDATNKVNSAKNELNTAINKKANSVDVYKKSETYTKSETDSKINVAKNDITLSVSNTYETKTNVETKVNNAVTGLKVGGNNLLRNGNFAYAMTNWLVHDMNSGGTAKSVAVENGGGDWKPSNKKVLVIKGTNTTDRYGVISSTMKLIPKTKYTISGYCAGHRVNKIQVNVRDKQGNDANIHTININPVSGGSTLDKWYRFETTFTTTSNTDFALNLYSVNFADNGYVWFCDVQIQQGTKATAWTPCLEDINSSIGTKANASDVYNKTEVYTKAETNSQINVAKSDITLAVSNTYETKANVETKVNNINFGIRNLARPTSGDWASKTGFNGRENQTWYPAKIYLDTLSVGDEITYSYDIEYSGITVNNGASTFRLTLQGSGNSTGWTTALPTQAVNLNIGSGSTRISRTFKLTAEQKKNSYFEFGFRTDYVNGGTIKYRCGMATKGNRVVQWSPAPEDITTSITNAKNDAINTASTDATNKVNSTKNELNTAINKKANSADVYTKSEVYTKAQTDSAIKVAKDEINLGVSNTYETKASVETKISNIQIGGTNLVKNSPTLNNSYSQLNTYKGTRTFVDDTAAKCGKHIKFECTAAGTGFYVNVWSGDDSCVGKKYTWSFYAKMNKAKTLNSIGHERGGIKNIAVTTEWQKFTHTWTYSSSGNRAFVFYPNFAVGDIFYIRDLKIEEGTKPSDWTPAPADIDSAIGTKANSNDVYKKTEVYTKAETNSQINVAKDSITNTVSSTYAKKTDVENTYATKSSLTQTTNSIIAKFEASGGYNLFKNSGFLTGDISQWGIQQHNSPTASWSIISHSNTWGFPDSSVKTFQVKMSNQTNKEYGLSQTINTTIGKKYTISFYCAAHRANNANIIVRRGDGTWLSNKFFNPQDSTKNGGNTSVDKWLYVTHTFTATGNSHAINLVLVNAQSDGYFWIAKPQVVEGEAPLSYSPNPSEVYSGNTVIDARGVTVTNGGFKVKNTSNKDVFWVDSNGQATVDNLQVYGNGASTINVYGNGHKHLKFESWTSHGAQISFNQLTGQNSVLVGRMITYPDQGANLYIEADSNIIVRSTRSSASANVACPLKVVGDVYGTAFRHWGDRFELYHDGADLRLKNKNTGKSLHLSNNGIAYYDNERLILSHRGGNVTHIGRANGYLEILTDQGAKGINYWDSDLKFKKNVQSIKTLKIKEDAPVTGLNLVNSIEHYTFDYKDGKHINVGYVSQQLETIDETLINKIEQPKDSPYWSEEDPYTRQPEVSTILPNVTLAIQEQQQIINAQSIEIEELKQKNEELEKRLKLIEEKLGL